MLGILTACRLPKRFAAGLTMAGVLCFMALTGFVPSVMRSGIMLLFYLGSQVMRRNADSINSLGLAVFLLGLANPYAAADTGLLLSFSATLGLLLFPPLRDGSFTRNLEGICSKFPASLKWDGFGQWPKNFGWHWQQPWERFYSHCRLPYCHSERFL